MSFKVQSLHCLSYSNLTPTLLFISCPFVNLSLSTILFHFANPSLFAFSIILCTSASSFFFFRQPRAHSLLLNFIHLHGSHTLSGFPDYHTPTVDSSLKLVVPCYSHSTRSASKVDVNSLLRQLERIRDSSSPYRKASGTLFW